MPNAAILIVEDDAACRDALCQTLADSERTVLTATSGAEGLRIIDKCDVALVISDLDMEARDGCAFFSSVREQYPDIPALLLGENLNVREAVSVMRAGAADYFTKPVDTDEIRKAIGRYLLRLDSSETLVAGDARTRELLKVAERVARTEATVTLSGDSGTGKEVFAQFIHDRSARRDHPFVAINCAAIPENMLEAVLFGYEKGSFTGASAAHAGKFEQANGGTLLLDEISEMDLALQAKLLRVLQEREVERIGGKGPVALNVRVLATTNRNLRQYVKDGRFREDLYYRLNVFPLHIPPLAERRDDIVPLAELALTRYAQAEPGTITLSDGAAMKLRQHDWPGNVRELENLMQRTLILLKGSKITENDLVFEDDAHVAEPITVGSADASPLQCGVRSREYQLIIDALNSTKGRRSEVAGLLGISARTLRYKLARMRAEGIRIPGDDPARVSGPLTAGGMQ